MLNSEGQEKSDNKDILKENKKYILALEATLYKKSQEYDNLNTNYNNLKKDYNNLKNDYIDLLNKFNSILNSTSWRITKPFRCIMNFVRKGL